MITIVDFNVITIITIITTTIAATPATNVAAIRLEFDINKITIIIVVIIKKLIDLIIINFSLENCYALFLCLFK